MKIISIDNIKTTNYTMWYKHEKSLSFKVFLVNEKIVSAISKIHYICGGCKKENSTLLRIFNSYLGKYREYGYLCKKCASNGIHLTDEEKKKKIENFTQKQNATKTKNKTTPKDLIAKNVCFGFIGSDKSTGSKIRDRMNETKIKNNTFGFVGTESHSKRIETYSQFSEERKELIKDRQNATKIKNGTHPIQKYERGERFGFCNMPPEEREILSKKIDEILKTVDEYGINIYTKAARKRVKKMKEDGKLIKDEERHPFHIYSSEVYRVTNMQPIHTLENIEKRGRADLNPDAYHLDHKFSIKEGFLNNIPAYIIGNIHNLEMIPHSENSRKQSQCSIDLETLINCVVNKDS